MLPTMHYSDEKTTQVNTPLRDYIKEVVATYYKNMLSQGIKPEKIYELIISEVELPLIEATMEYTAGNQSRSAKILGMNRGTYRKKLNRYGMLKSTI